MRSKNIQDENNLYVDCQEYIITDTINNISLKDNLKKSIREQLIFFKENEPLKILKKSHHRWEISINHLNNMYEKLSNDLQQEYKDLEEIMVLVPRQN